MPCLFVALCCGSHLAVVVLQQTLDLGNRKTSDNTPEAAIKSPDNKNKTFLKQRDKLKERRIVQEGKRYNKIGTTTDRAGKGDFSFSFVHTMGQFLFGGICCRATENIHTN